MSTRSDWFCEEGLLIHAVRTCGWIPPIEPCIPGYAEWQELRRGGQGVVYRATQLSTRRQVAIKILSNGSLASRDQLRRFDREVDTIAGFQHPHIVRLYDRGLTEQGLPYYVMELIDGCSLDEYIQQRSWGSTGASRIGARRFVPPSDRAAAGDLGAAGHWAERGSPIAGRLATRRTSDGEIADWPVDKLLMFFAKVCEAVAYAHAHGVIHRDLKPGNILIDREDEPHVLDFGLAKSTLTAEPTSSAAVSRTGDFMGTLPWASPEQVEGVPGRIDARSDVYALGVILYQMLTGAFPYPVAGLREAIDSIRQVEPRGPGALRKDVDGALDAIVLKCLAKNPPDRYRNAEELAGDIRHYLAGEPLVARRESLVSRLRRRVRRNQPAAVLVGTLLLCGAGVAALVWVLRTSGATGEQAAAQAGAGAPWKTVGLRDGPTVVLNSLAGLGSRIRVPTHLTIGHETPGGATLQRGQSLDVSGNLTVGDDANARLEVLDGASVICWGARVGARNQAEGLVIVRGSGTRWAAQSPAPDSWIMTGGRSGELQILDGAVVEDCRAHIAWEGTGRVVVDGPGSTWKHRFFFEIGRFGKGELLVRNGGRVSNLHAWVGRIPQSKGEVVVAGPGSQWFNGGSLHLGGSPELPGQRGGPARLSIEDGGAVVVCHMLRIWPPGMLALNEGTLTAAEIDHGHGGRFDFTGGTLQVETFVGDLINEGGMLTVGYRSGATTITGSYTQVAGALALTLRGTAAPYASRLSISETATLGGSLVLDCTADFRPSRGAEYVILEAKLVEGGFEHPAGRIDFAGGGSCELIYTPTQVILTHFEDPRPGRDGPVDATFCDSCRLPATDGPFPVRLAENTTGDTDLTFVGPPDNIGFMLRDRSVVYDFGASRVADGDGPDFNIYEWFFGGFHHADLDVQASENGTDFVSVQASDDPAVRIPGDEAHAAPRQIRGYDLAATHLSAVRYIRISGLPEATLGHACLFHLDTIGAIHYEPAEAGPSETPTPVGGRQ